MRTQHILLASLLAALYGCQPEAPAQQAAAPAEGSLRAPAGSEVAAPAPAQQAEPATVEKAAQPVAKEKIAAVKEKPAQAAPAQTVAAPAVKAEPAPVAAEANPEVKSEPAVSEAEAMQLAKKSNCLACHAIDKKVVGPAWKDVAAKYRGDAGAEARLMNKIAKGGSGVWGIMAMPASPQISEADRRVLARFVLSLK